MLALGHGADDDNRHWEMCRSGQLSTPSGDPQVSSRDAIKVTSHRKPGPLPTPRLTLLSTGQLERLVCLQATLQGKSLGSDAKKGKGCMHIGVPEEGRGPTGLGCLGPQGGICTQA